MKKILSLLGTMILATTTSISAVACGNSNQPKPKPDAPVDFTIFLKKAQEKINALFGNLITEKKNLLKPSNFAQDDSGPLLTKLATIGDDRKIDDSDITTSFLDLIKENTQDFGRQLANDSNLKSLFYGINTSDILKFNIQKSIIKKNKFDEWKKNNAFGIASYTKNKYNITSWYHLTATINLTLNYKDGQGQVQGTEENISYDFYFANQDAQIETIVSAASDNIINNKLGQYLAQINNFKNINYEWDTNNMQDLKNLVETDVKNHINNSHIRIITSELSNNKSVSNASSYWNEVGINYKSKNDLQKYLVKTTTESKERFKSALNDWNSIHLIPPDKIDNVAFFANIKLTNWKYDNLSLLPAKVPTIVLENQTITEKITSTVEQLVKITNIEDGLIKNKIDYDESNNNLNMKMNSSDFDDYIRDGNTFNDIQKYIEGKLEAATKTARIIKTDDILKVKIKPWMWMDEEDLSKTKLEDKKSTDGQSTTYNFISNSYNWFKINVNGYIFSLNFKKTLTIIKGDDDNIWN